MGLYRKKPVVIEAMQWTGENTQEVLGFGLMNVYYTETYGVGCICIRTLEGVMTASKGDWIICGVNGEFYPCKPDIFEKTYEPANDLLDDDIPIP